MWAKRAPPQTSPSPVNVLRPLTRFGEDTADVVADSIGVEEPEEGNVLQAIPQQPGISILHVSGQEHPEEKVERKHKETAEREKMGCKHD